MDQFEVVPAVEEHVAKILELAEQGGLSPWTEADYRAEVNRDDSIFLLIQERASKQTRGFIVARLITNRDNPAPSQAEILNITTAPEYRNLGLGTALLAAAIRKISERAPATVWLEVRCSNDAAIAFYGNNGFTVEYVRKNFYSNPTEDAFVMKMEV
jgi:ribosomal-protein-alanine N-acetyltransferase